MASALNGPNNIYKLKKLSYLLSPECFIICFQKEAVFVAGKIKKTQAYDKIWPV
jgi:hypothetical protein